MYICTNLPFTARLSHPVFFEVRDFISLFIHIESNVKKNAQHIFLKC